MKSLNININIYNLILNSNLYKNFILRIYIYNSLEYIDRNNLTDLIQLFNLYRYKINLNNVNTIYEVITINDQTYNLINKYILFNFIKTHNDELLYNTVIFIIENVNKMKLYPEYIYQIKKFENEIKKLKTEVQTLQNIKKDVEDLKVTINYINNKINKLYNTDTNTDTNINTNIHSDINTYSFYFPKIT